MVLEKAERVSAVGSCAGLAPRLEACNDPRCREPREGGERLSNEEEIRKMDTADGHETLIRAQWRDFAAFAWQQYQARGRGAVVVDLKRAVAEAKPGGHIPSYYVADSSEQLKTRGGWPSNEIAEVIQDYDPELDVVFLFIRVDGDVFHYNVSDEITPPKA